VLSQVILIINDFVLHDLTNSQAIQQKSENEEKTLEDRLLLCRKPIRVTETLEYFCQKNGNAW